MAQRIFILRFQTDADGAIRRLRNTLKTALRRDRLRCISAHEEKQTAAGAAHPARASQCKGEQCNE
jgi:hypothetical protein